MHRTDPRRRRSSEAESTGGSMEIRRDMLQEILLKLPTKDVARCGCVSRLWRRVVTNPSFRNLHAMATQVVSAAQISKTLLVSERREAGQSDEAAVFDVSSGKVMCRVPIPGHYGLANVCNGLLCFVHGSGGGDPDPEAPAVLCNPVTGETVALPRAPPQMVTSKGSYSHQFALGFSPATKEHKLFRLSTHTLSTEQRVEMDVCTLGDAAGGWRHHSFLSAGRPTPRISSPVLIDGKLYVMTNGWNHRYPRNEIPSRILEINVATESCRVHRLPQYQCSHVDQPPVGAFELGGRLCFAAHVFNCNRPEVNGNHFWVMSTPPEGGDGDDEEPNWDLRYSFRIEPERPGFWFGRPWSCWLDDDEMLCYACAGVLHKYGTRQGSSTSTGGFLRWDQEVDLPVAPLMTKCRWNVYKGYRPTLLSPLIFAAAPPSRDDYGNKHQFEHAMLSLLR